LHAHRRLRQVPFLSGMCEVKRACGGYKSTKCVWWKLQLFIHNVCLWLSSNEFVCQMDTVDSYGSVTDKKEEKLLEKQLKLQEQIHGQWNRFKTLMPHIAKAYEDLPNQAYADGVSVEK
jgi:hypothetical protein